MKGATMTVRMILTAALAAVAGGLGRQPAPAADAETWDGTIVQHGKMHEAIGRQQHQGRVHLNKLLQKPNFFGVAALERLAGEVTIYDGQLTVTRVDDAGTLQSTDTASPDTQATLLIGAYVPAWTEHEVTETVGPEDIEQYLADVAEKEGLRLSKPFPFSIEGAFSEVRLHVINGACPMHARLHKRELPKDARPFEAELEKVRGTVVGVFAKDAVGDITHPATSTHMHLVYENESGTSVTGHVERIGLLKGSRVRLPRVK